MERRSYIAVAVILANLVSMSQSIPKKYHPTGLSANYFTPPDDQVAIESKTTKPEYRDLDQQSNELNHDERSPVPRFGVQTAGTITASGNSLFPGLNNGPLKLDLGGLLLGAVLGFGAVLVLPKLLHIFNPQGGYDGYKRSEDGNKESTVMQILSNVDETLSQYNIDSSSCMQRAVCSYVKSTATKVEEGSANNFDALVDALAGNSILGFMLDGTSIKQALELGHQGGDCDGTFARCPFNKENVFAALKGLMSNDH